MKKALKQGLKVLAAGGLKVTTFTANSGCTVWAHQPKMPVKYKSLRKF